MRNRTDRDWEQFGKDDPYYGVIAHDRFRKSSMTDEDREAFFASGQDHISAVMKNIHRHFDPSFSIHHALEFGCGVGRLLIPLSRIAGRVTGVDVSESMLREAKRNCEARNADNVFLAKTDDRLSVLENSYDFILSFIVFQHIPVRRGERIFADLLTHLKEGGIGVFHFIYAQQDPLTRLVFRVKKTIPLAKNLIGFIRQRDFFAPHMQMNPYRLERIAAILREFRIDECFAEHTNHGGFLGINLYFRKPVPEAPDRGRRNLIDELFAPPHAS